MSLRKTPFINSEFYHIYNRGVDKRIIFSDEDDIARFIQSMHEFNSIEPIGSIYEKTFVNNKLGGKASKSKKLVNFIAYCLNPNHYHFILEQVEEDGISKFMQRIGTGYAMYFNEKYDRGGALFQGKFKSVHIDSNEYLLHLSAYVNLNDRVHQLGGKASKLVGSESSWGEYVGDTNRKGINTKNTNVKNTKAKGGDSSKGFCKKDIVMDQFKGVKEYKKFARDSLQAVLEKRYESDNFENFLLED